MCSELLCFLFFESATVVERSSDWESYECCETTSNHQEGIALEGAARLIEAVVAGFQLDTSRHHGDRRDRTHYKKRITCRLTTIRRFLKISYANSSPFW